MFDPEDRLPLENLKGCRVAAFSGIAVPESFENFLMQFGAQILYVKRFLDHHRFSEEELNGIFHHAAEADAEYVVTTEKDAVRIDRLPDSHIPLYYLRLEIELLSGRDDFEAAVARICFPKGDIGQNRMAAEVAAYKRVKER